METQFSWMYLPLKETEYTVYANQFYCFIAKKEKENQKNQNKGQFTSIATRSPSSTASIVVNKDILIISLFCLQLINAEIKFLKIGSVFKS